MGYESTVTVGQDHPSLEGHFPGHPIVPGVVLLNEVLHIVREASVCARTVIGLPMVKFSSPVRPGEVVMIQVDLDEVTGATFSCRVATRLVASGTIELAPVRAGSTELK